MLLRTRRFNLPTTDALAAMQREMENIFGRVLSDVSENGGAVRGWRAPVAMWDDADKVFLEVEVPGVSKESIDLTVHNGIMRVSGERKAPEGERNYWVNDRAYGAFDRTVTLPEDVDPESIDARLCEGVLHIVLSKRPEAQPKKITVRD
jgi:HSP20 family protein